VIGQRRRRAAAIERIADTPEPAREHPDLEIADDAPEPPVPEPQSRWRPILGLLLTSLLLLAAVSGLVWHFFKPGFSVQGAMTFRLAPATDTESAAVQRLQEVLLADSATSEAALALLPEGVAPGFLGDGRAFTSRAIVQWQRAAAIPDQARLLLAVRGIDDADSTRVTALMKALFESNLKAGQSELSRLQSELAAGDEQSMRRDMNYLEQRLKELAEEVRVLELTAVSADEMAQLQKAVADARTHHRRAVEERIRAEVKNTGAASASTGPAAAPAAAPAVAARVRAVEEAEQALAAAEKALQQATAKEQHLQARRVDVQSIQQRIKALKAALSSRPGPGATTQQAISRTTPLPPERTLVVPDPDQRGWWIAAASVATAILFAVAVAFSRSAAD
jgi:hypothetical protein